MNIAFDIRPLLDQKITGVGEYTYNVLNNILKLDKDNNYYLFYNAFSTPDTIKSFDFPNVKYCEFNYPNKLFNLILNYTDLIKIDQIIKKKYKVSINLFFFPNLSFINTSNKCKTFTTVHDLSFKINPHFFSLKRNLWHKFINPKKILNHSNKILSVSKNTKQDIVSIYNIDPNKIHTTYLGIDDQYKQIQQPDNKINQIRNHYNLPSKFILYLGTLEPRKNIISILQAFEKLNTPHHLVIAGRNGWKYKKIYEKAKKNNKKNKIHFIGYINKKDKPYLYNLASLFVFPSFYEGFGFPPLEASKCGCPVIISSGSCLGEINKNSAIYINPYNTTQLKESIETVLTNKTLRENLIKKGLDLSQQYTWEKTAQKTLDIINQNNSGYH